MCSGPQAPAGTKASTGYKVSDTGIQNEIDKWSRIADSGGFMGDIAKAKLRELQPGSTIPPTPEKSAVLGSRISPTGTSASDLIMPVIAVPRG